MDDLDPTDKIAEVCAAHGLAPVIARAGFRWPLDWLAASAISLAVHAGGIVAMIALHAASESAPTIDIAGGGPAGDWVTQISLPESADDAPTASPALPPATSVSEVPPDHPPDNSAISDLPIVSALDDVPVNVIGLSPQRLPEFAEIVPHLHDEVSGPRIQSHPPFVATTAIADTPSSDAPAGGTVATGGTATDTPPHAGQGEGTPGGQSGILGGLDGRAIPQPAYPSESRRRGEQGTVVLEVSIRADGSIAGIRVVSDAGFPRLAEAAIAALQRAHLSPPLIDGKAVDAVVRVPFQFTLR